MSIRKPSRRLPKVQVQGAYVVRGRFHCYGPYSALPMNPFQHPQWPPFRVRFNGCWHAVEVTQYSEDWGWRAEGIDTLNDDLDVYPKVELR